MIRGSVSRIKLVMLGSTNVGKSTLAHHYVKGIYLSHQETIGAAFLTKSIKIDESNTLEFQIWDTAGQERYNAITPMYYRGAQVAIVTYDITYAESLDRAKIWIEKLIKEEWEEKNNLMVIALVGNKCDLESRRAIKSREVEDYAKQKGIIFMETSAKTGKNVHKLFDSIANSIPKNIEALSRNVVTSIALSELDSDEQRKCCH